MEKNTRIPKTNGHYAEIIATLPKSTVKRFGHMVEVAIQGASNGTRYITKYDTVQEIAAYDAAYAATLVWMNG